MPPEGWRRGIDPRSGPAGEAARPIRVLVVEDDLEVMKVLTEMLVQHGHEVVPAQNGVAAMVALTAPDPDCPEVVLLDLGLPLESGLSVLSFLRNVMRSGLPVVVLTGRNEPEEEAAVRALGVSDYLHKPASPSAILAAIAKAVA